MKKITIGISLAAMTIAGVAYAQPGMRPNPADTDGNGVITRSEAQAHAAQMFARFDANKDGKLDSADREARRAAMFERIDANHDGQISRAEFDAMHQRGRGDGKGKGWGGHKRGHHRGMMMLRMADANGDGAVSQAEFTAAALKRFDQTDANGDGQVTKEERQAAWAAKRERWQGRMGQPDAPPPPAN